MMARYDAFLLRIWHSGDAAAGQWSIRLQHLPDGQVARLGTLEGLVAHLLAVLHMDTTAPEAPTPVETPSTMEAPSED